MSRLALVIVGLASLAVAGIAGAQSKKTVPPRPAATSSSTRPDDVSHLAAESVKALGDYRGSLEKLLLLQETEVRRATEWLEYHRARAAQDAAAAGDVAQGERALADAQASAEETRQWLSEADYLLGEALALEELAKLPPLPVGGYVVTDAIIRYNGPARWSLADTPKVARFFVATFGRPMPISAAGQTPVHDRIGFDHRDALDVSVHPDSSEGRGLMDFLRRSGIPFVAFRRAVPGSATGAHVHIGPPSRRITAAR